MQQKNSNHLKKSSDDVGVILIEKFLITCACWFNFIWFNFTMLLIFFCSFSIYIYIYIYVCVWRIYIHIYINEYAKI